MKRNKQVLTLASVAALAVTGAQTLSAAEVTQPVKGANTQTQTNGQSSVKDIEVVNKESKTNYNKAVDEVGQKVPNLKPIVEGSKAKVEPVVQGNKQKVDAFNEKVKQEVKDFNEKQEQIKVQNAQAVQSYQTAQTQDVSKSNAGLTQGEKDKLNTQIKNVDSVAKADAVTSQINDINKKVDAQNEAAKAKEAKEQAAQDAVKAENEKVKIENAKKLEGFKAEALKAFDSMVADMKAKATADTPVPTVDYKTLIKDAKSQSEVEAIVSKFNKLREAFNSGVAEANDKAKQAQAAVDQKNKDALAKYKNEMNAKVDASKLTDTEKAELKTLIASTSVDSKAVDAKIDALNKAHQAEVDKINADGQAKIKAENDAAKAKYEADKAEAARLDAEKAKQQADANKLVQDKYNAEDARISFKNSKTHLLEGLQSAAKVFRSGMDPKEYNALINEIVKAQDKATVDALKTKIDAFIQKAKQNHGDTNLNIQTVSKVIISNSDVIKENPGLEITYDKNTDTYHFNKDISVFGQTMTEQEFNDQRKQGQLFGFIDSKNEEVKTTAVQIAEAVKDGSNLPVQTIQILDSKANGQSAYVTVTTTLDQKSGLVNFEISSEDLSGNGQRQSIYSGHSISDADTALKNFIGNDKASTFYEEAGGTHNGYNEIKSDFINDLIARITTSDRYAKDGDSIAWSSWYTSVDVNTGQSTKVTVKTPDKMIKDILEKGSSTSANDLGNCFHDSALSFVNIPGFGGGGWTIQTQVDAKAVISDHCTIYTGQTENKPAAPTLSLIAKTETTTVTPPVLKTYTDVVYNKLDKETLVIDTSKQQTVEKVGGELKAVDFDALKELPKIEQAKLLEKIKTETLTLKDLENEKVFKPVELPKVEFDKLSLPQKIEEIKNTIEEKVETPKEVETSKEVGTPKEVIKEVAQKVETPKEVIKELTHKVETPKEVIKEVAQKVDTPKIKEVAQVVKETTNAQPETKVELNDAPDKVRGAAKTESKNFLMPLVISVLAVFGITIKRKRK